MFQSRRKPSIQFVGVCLATLLAAFPAMADDLKVLCSGAFKQSLLSVQPLFERNMGHRLIIQTDTAGGLAKRIEAGDAFDVVIITPAALQPALSAGQVDARSVRELAKVGVGVAVKAGAPEPRLDTVEDFKNALLAAKAPTYIDPAAGGSSGIYVAKLIQQLGIADQVGPKAVLGKGGYVAEKLVTGEADLAIHQISEILPVPGVKLVGPLPAAIQHYTVYAAALSTQTQHRQAGESLLQTLTSPEAKDVLLKKGMQVP